ncbi:MAG: anthranilate phosphoribosyltransferase [Parachlamydiales bacterium]|nr:anthranilate phosphoribosyltransferase [Candidatus Acheromyda pituitae]
MLNQVLEKLLNSQNLTFTESRLAIDEILTDADPHQTAAFLALMRAKGESVEELSGVIAAMRSCMTPVPLSCPVLDIVGTGGDGAHTVNISTGAAILAAACGVKVAKHGNRSVSSQSGSADVLEALGIEIHKKPDEIKALIEEIGISFIFAPDYHPAMLKIKEVRKRLKVRTLFNLIGPLLNPASPDYLMIGVADPQLLKTMAQILLSQKVKRALVFHGAGLDELTTIGPAEILEVSEEGIKAFHLDPQELGFAPCAVDDLKGADAMTNAQVLIDVLKGKAGPIADTLILNAAVAVYLYGIAPTVKQAVQIVKECIQNNKAIEQLNLWRQS